MLYSITLDIHNNIEISKFVISPDVIIKIYIEKLTSCIYVSSLLTAKKASFTKYLSTHVHHVIYKTNTITTITEYIEHCNAPVILNPYVQYSHISLSLVIAGIHFSPISYEDKLHQPIKHTDVEYSSVNISMSFQDIGIYETDFDIFISYMINSNPNFTEPETTDTILQSDSLSTQINAFSGGVEYQVPLLYPSLDRPNFPLLTGY